MIKRLLFIVLLQLFIVSSAILPYAVFAQELVQFDFKVKPNATSDNTCITNSVTVTDESTGSQAGQTSASTQVGTADCGPSVGGGTKPSGIPVTGFLNTPWCANLAAYGEACHPVYDIPDAPWLEPDSDINGQKVYAPHSGEISESVWMVDNGGVMSIKSKDKDFTYMTRYVHLNEATVNNWSVGQSIMAGTLLGYTYTKALTYSTGEHLHYETRKVPSTQDISPLRCPQNRVGHPEDVYPCVDPIEFVGSFDETSMIAGQNAIGWTPK